MFNDNIFYWLREMEIANLYGESSSNSETKRFWNKLWKLKVQGKVKIFIWKLFNNFLPCASNLLRKGCDIVNRCTVCGFGEENPKHLFLECWWTKSFWSNLSFERITDVQGNLCFKEWLYYVLVNLSSDNIMTLCYGLRSIWYNRNSMLHGNPMLNPFDAALNVRSTCYRYKTKEFSFGLSGNGAMECWKFSAHDSVKINCDASYNKQTGNGGAACIAKDKNDVVMGVHAEKLLGIYNSLDAEGFSILLALQWVKNMGWKNCFFATDCAGAYEKIMCRNSATVTQWPFRCARLLAENEGWNLMLIRREENEDADSLARKTAVTDWSWSDNFSIPWCSFLT